MPTIECPKCSQQYKVSEAHSGKVLQCQKCGQKFVAPEFDVPEPEDASDGVYGIQGVPESAQHDPFESISDYLEEETAGTTLPYRSRKKRRKSFSSSSNLRNMDPEQAQIDRALRIKALWSILVGIPLVAFGMFLGKITDVHNLEQNPLTPGRIDAFEAFVMFAILIGCTSFCIGIAALFVPKVMLVKEMRGWPIGIQALVGLAIVSGFAVGGVLFFWVL